jgi:hypothetical protein
MNSEDHDFTSAEDLDFIASAGLLWAGVLGLVFFGSDVARFLNSLFINL